MTTNTYRALCVYRTLSSLHAPGSSHYLYLIFHGVGTIIIYIFVYEETQAPTGQVVYSRDDVQQAWTVP